MDRVRRLYWVGLVAALSNVGLPLAAQQVQPAQVEPVELKPGELPPRPAPPRPQLCEPATAGDLDKVKKLLAKGADVNAVDSLKRTPLMLSMARADVSGDAAPINGKQLSAAERETRKVKIARLLLKSGADVRRRSEIGLTALHYAAMWPGDEKVALDLAREIVAKGADVDARMATGITPLRMAVDRKRVQITRFLVEKGADPLAEDQEQKTPYSRARSLRSPELLQALIPPQPAAAATPAGPSQAAGPAAAPSQAAPPAAAPPQAAVPSQPASGAKPGATVQPAK